MSVSILSVLSVAAAVYFTYKFFNGFTVPTNLKEVPKISLAKYLWSALLKEPMDDRHDRMLAPALEKNGMIRIWIQGRWEVLVSDVKSLKMIFRQTDVFLKTPLNEPINNSLGQKFFGRSNLALSNMDDWKRHRRAVNSGFKKSWPTTMFAGPTFELIEILEAYKGEAIEVNEIFHKLALDVLGKGLFSYNFNYLRDGDNDKFLQMYNEIFKGILHQIYFLFPFLEDWVPSRRRLHGVTKEFRTFLTNVIESKRRDIELKKNCNEDLVTLMLSNSIHIKEDGLSDEDIVNDLSTFFLAGHDTTGNSLVAVMYFLAKYPKLQERVRNEVLSILGDSNQIRVPTNEQQKEFVYLNCFIKEALRMVPQGGILRRYCNQDTTLPNGITITKGTWIDPYLYGHHKNPEVFPDPEIFDPDRYKNPFSIQSKSLMAFGSGTRLCTGLKFSFIEQRVALSMLLQKFVIELGPETSQLEKPILSNTALVYIKNLDIKFIPRF